MMGIIRYGKHGIAVLLFMLKLLDWFSVSSVVWSCSVSLLMTELCITGYAL